MRRYFCWVGICSVVALVVYDIKYNVQTTQKETRRLEQELIRERERVQMLELEWTHLTRPERIRALTEAHTNLTALRQGNIYPEHGGEMWHVLMQQEEDVYVP